MQEILNHNPNESQKSNLFSKLAFACIVSLIGLLIGPYFLNINIEFQDYAKIGMLILFFIGFFFTIRSYEKKEEVNIYKQLSIIFYGFIISLILIGLGLTIIKIFS